MLKFLAPERVKNIEVRGLLFSKLNIETDMTNWAEPDMTNCNQLVTISDLDNVTVTTGKGLNHIHSG